MPESHSSLDHMRFGADAILVSASTASSRSLVSFVACLPFASADSFLVPSSGGTATGVGTLCGMVARPGTLCEMVAGPGRCALATAIILGAAAPATVEGGCVEPPTATAAAGAADALEPAPPLALALTWTPALAAASGGAEGIGKPPVDAGVTGVPSVTVTWRNEASTFAGKRATRGG